MECQICKNWAAVDTESFFILSGSHNVYFLLLFYFLNNYFIIYFFNNYFIIYLFIYIYVYYYYYFWYIHQGTLINTKNRFGPTEFTAEAEVFTDA